VISPHVAEPDAEPALGELVAAGPRAARAPGEYAEVIESVREGFLLHYGEPRIVRGADGDLALLAGDYLYAIGLERLAALADLEAVRELADLISICAQLEAEGGRGAAELWLGVAVAVAAGAAPGHREAKARLREGAAEAPAALLAAAREQAARAGLGEALGRAADSIGFAASDSR